MSLKRSAFAGVAICAVMAGCQAGNSVWNKPEYQPAPVNDGASRTYSPIESVSPYQQQGPPISGGSGTTSGGSGTR